MPAKRLAFAESARPSEDLPPIEPDEGQSDATSMSAMDMDEDDDDEYDDDEYDETDAVSTYNHSYYRNMTYCDAPIEIDGADQAASTRSLCVPDLGYMDLHNRRYCKNYFMPNDEHELARMTLLQQVHLCAFDGALTTVTLDNPTKILDIGTGTGEWAIRMGELYRNCEVVGTDISAIQDTSVPPNVFFEIDDAEDTWERPANSVDLVHLRHMDGAFKDISFVYRQAFETLKPGGWLEQKEWNTGSGGYTPPSGAVATSEAFDQLASRAFEAAELAGRPWFPGSPDPQALIEAGFVDVRVVEHVFPVRCDGPRGNAGKMWLIVTLEGLEAFCLRLLTEQHGMTPAEVRDLCALAAGELVALARDPEWSQSACVKIGVLKGRKPFPHEVSRSSSSSGGAVINNGVNGERRTASPDSGMQQRQRPISAAMSSPPSSPRRVHRKARKSGPSFPRSERGFDVAGPSSPRSERGPSSPRSERGVDVAGPSSAAAAATTLSVAVTTPPQTAVTAGSTPTATETLSQQPDTRPST